MGIVLENLKAKACRAEARRRRVSALIRNAHGVAEWELFIGD